MRTLAIDLGNRRVGLAISDAGGKLASPLDVLSVSSADQAIDPIIKIISREDVQQVVLGMPLNMDDSLGPAARQTLAWRDKLRSRCDLPIIFVDERLSSFAAEQELISQKRLGNKITRKKKKQRLDALAAAEFLQAFLDGKLPAINQPIKEPRTQ